MQTPEQVKPYDDRGHKAEQVEQMFDAIAPSYDFMNTAMTFGMHRLWRNRALHILRRMMGDAVYERPRLLDVACGTGDVAFHLATTFPPQTRIVGIDLSEGMLRVARRRLDKMSPEIQECVSFHQGDCLHLPYPDGVFDAVTVAYGVRNFEHLEQGYAEMRRVLRPGGVLCVIELCEPGFAPMRLGYRLYSRHVIPLAGRLISRDTRAYTYLPQSIAACPARASMTDMMRRVGLRDPHYHILFPGVVGIYTARR